MRSLLTTRRGSPPQSIAAGSREWWRIDAAGAGACVAMTLVLYLTGVQPMLSDHEAFIARQGELVARRSGAAKLDMALAALKTRLNGVEQALAGSSMRLEPVSNVNRRLAEMSRLAAETGLKIDEVQTGAASFGAHYGTVPIHLAGTGKYRTCVAFLHRMREEFPDTGVASMDLTANAANPFGPGTFRFGLTWHALPMRAGEDRGTPPR